MSEFATLLSGGLSGFSHLAPRVVGASREGSRWTANWSAMEGRIQVSSKGGWAQEPGARTVEETRLTVETPG